jgi:hypothetical protein
MAVLNMGQLAKQAVAPNHDGVLVPAGTYTFTVTAAQPKLYRSGNHGVDVDITIEDGPTIRWVHLSLNLDNPGSFFNQLTALGIEAQFFAKYDDDMDDDELVIVMKDVAKEVIGRRGKAYIAVADFNGREVNNVGFFKKVKP